VAGGAAGFFFALSFLPQGLVIVRFLLRLEQAHSSRGEFVEQLLRCSLCGPFETSAGAPSGGRRAGDHIEMPRTAERRAR